MLGAGGTSRDEDDIGRMTKLFFRSITRTWSDTAECAFLYAQFQMAFCPLRNLWQVQGWQHVYVACPVQPLDKQKAWSASYLRNQFSVLSRAPGLIRLKTEKLFLECSLDPTTKTPPNRSEVGQPSSEL